MSIELVMFQKENDKKFGLPVFEDGCIVVADKVWLLGFLEGGEILK